MMVQMSEDRLAMAERFVRENERRTAKQAAIIARLESEGRGTRRAMELLVIFQGALGIAREHLRRERGKHRLLP
jgi:hypothetical protein